jgi:GT2 family glycosyltransferase
MSDGVKPSVSVVVLSYNRPALLSEALTSLRAQTYKAFEVTVVDNPSAASEEVARLVGKFPDFKVFRSRSNLGYAAGMNRGIALSAGEYTLLTEDDIVLERDCIRCLVEYAEGDPKAGLVGPVIYNKSGGTIRCAGGERSLSGIYRVKIYGEGELDQGQFPRPFDVGYVDGAVVFARTQFLRGLGGFREEFFMYGESVELCERVAKAGARMTTVPGAKVHHFEPPPQANSSSEFSFHRYKNLFSLYLLHAPARHLPEFFARYALLGLLRALAGRGGEVRPLLRALCWSTRRAPALLKERLSAGRNAAPHPPAGREVSSGNRLG